MSKELTPELKKQLDDESREYAAMFKYGKEYRQNAHFDGAKSFVLKWQEAEQRADRYERALKDIRRWELATGKKTRVTRLDILNDIMRVVNNALTPKTSTDEQ